MRFELFDRDAAAGEPAPVGPVVRVNERGQVLFNAATRAFLQMQGAVSEVSLLFDPETRTAAVAPVAVAGNPGTRWKVGTYRSLEWPVGVSAREFVVHYRVAAGEYPAKLLRGPGPRMVTFEVGAAQELPAHPVDVDRDLPVGAASGG